MVLHWVDVSNTMEINAHQPVTIWGPTARASWAVFSHIHNYFCIYTPMCLSHILYQFPFITTLLLNIKVNIYSLITEYCLSCYCGLFTVNCILKLTAIIKHPWSFIGILSYSSFPPNNQKLSIPCSDFPHE